MNLRRGLGEPRDWQITIRYKNRGFLYFVDMNINIYTAVFKSVLIWKYKLNIYIPFLFSSKRCWQNEFRGSFQKESTIATVKISQSLCFPFARFFQSPQASICLDVLCGTNYYHQINEGTKMGVRFNCGQVDKFPAKYVYDWIDHELIIFTRFLFEII